MENLPRWRPSRPKRWMFCISLLSCTMILYIGNQNTNIRRHLTTSRSSTKNKVRYGHLHMAKTAGTALNQAMAKLYKNVCGNKGFTFKTDFQLIQRRELFKDVNYEDCDWISSEKPASFWDALVDPQQAVELHVPCRDPVHHLMAIVKYEDEVFDCDAANMKRQVDRFMTYVVNRFHPRLYRRNLDMKCFDYFAVPQYVDYMSQYLDAVPKHRIADFIRPMGAPANPRRVDDECIWKDKELVKSVEEYMISKYHYYDFCSKCIGTDRDLFSSFEYVLD
uniref:Uncharacterized protein n=1 Tax=Helicotheca tamesis TaxID=374047 RepID=A0A7S2IHD6_9STRA|mmetsp:Transcript_9371/g.13033  ORF Transcript_9371/g.13033 Transcript_9371/m.13033 type:complete len:278 (+) Transcript_9371:47-880(+)